MYSNTGYQHPSPSRHNQHYQQQQQPQPQPQQQNSSPTDQSPTMLPRSGHYGYDTGSSSLNRIPPIGRISFGQFEQFDHYQQPSPYQTGTYANARAPQQPYPGQYPGWSQSQYSQPYPGAGQPQAVAPSTQAAIPAQNHPPSPFQGSDEQGGVEEEDAFRSEHPPPAPELRTHEDKIWELQVVQEPKRARMCGYGDRDRRPITSPPIVKLVIRDANTLKEIDYQNSGLVLQHFSCNVMICDVKGDEDKTLLKGHPAQQIISAASLTAYPTNQIPESPVRTAELFDPRLLPSHGANTFQHTAAVAAAAAVAPGRGFPPSQAPPIWNGHTSPYNHPSPTPYGSSSTQRQLPPLSSSQQYSPMARPQQPPTPPAEGTNSPGTAFARNLIGQTCSSAHCLQDEHDEWGIFFIFSDLSVRTEEWFRLKFLVFNIGTSVSGLTQDEILHMAANNNAAPTTGGPETGKRGSKSMDGIRNSLVGKESPCLASVYSACFKVYSAKKFPGVVDSTPLMRSFAKQGIKISIRKEPKAGEKRKRDGEGDGDDGEEAYDGDDGYEADD